MKDQLRKKVAADLPVLSFESPKTFERWLAANHTSPAGIWLRISKRNSPEKSVTYAEALDVALCYGWIDGQKNRFDDQSWLQRFTPRRAKSPWSKINTRHAERLISAGKMKPAGLKQIEAAREDGRWDRAYDSHRTFTLPKNFLKELAKDKKAKAFFGSLSRGNKYAIAYRLQTAKRPETKEKRLKMIIEMLKKGEKYH